MFPLPDGCSSRRRLEGAVAMIPTPQPMASSAQFDDEIRIEWERDPTDMAYVRVRSRPAGTRQRGVTHHVGERVGYAVLRADAPSPEPGVFRRRVFYLKDHDRPNDPDGGYSTGAPAEAVDPLTVEPGVPGELTERAWGAPLSSEGEAP